MESGRVHSTRSAMRARRAFAANLRRLRDERGLSQEALAALADLHRTYIGSVERAERNISIDSMQRIADALKVDLRDLLKGDSR